MVRAFSSPGGVLAVLAATILVGLAWLAGGPAAATDPPGVAARAINVAPAPSGALVTVDLDAPVAARTFFLAGDNPRFVVDLPGARWRLGRAVSTPAPSASIRGLRYADHDTGVSRLVLDLSAPGALLNARQTRLESGGVRLTYEIAVSTPRPALSEPRPARAAEVALASARPAPAQADSRRVIVIDAGHGGRDPGAIGVSGVHEKAITLQSALRLREILEATGRYHVVLTRDSDAYVDLAGRVRFARSQEADLFISLHADAAANAEASGASVYTLSEQGGQRAQRIMGQQNWRLDLGDAPANGAVGQILIDLAQRDTTNRSAAFARTLIDHLEPVTPLLRNTHRNAGFFVLLAPDVPAVLVELGFLTNPSDERRLSDARQRDAMMRAVARAIDEHFAGPQLLLAAR